MPRTGSGSAFPPFGRFFESRTRAGGFPPSGLRATGSDTDALCGRDRDRLHRCRGFGRGNRASTPRRGRRRGDFFDRFRRRGVRASAELARREISRRSHAGPKGIDPDRAHPPSSAARHRPAGRPTPHCVRSPRRAESHPFFRRASFSSLARDRVRHSRRFRQRRTVAAGRARSAHPPAEENSRGDERTIHRARVPEDGRSALPDLDDLDLSDRARSSRRGLPPRVPSELMRHTASPSAPTWGWSRKELFRDE